MLLIALSLLSTTATAAQPLWYYPGRGDDIAVLDADGSLAGLPVGRTGSVLVKADDADALASLPEVAWVRHRLGGVVELRVHDGVDEFALSRALHNQPGVQWAHPDFVLPIVSHGATDWPDDPFVADQWHLENTGQDGWTAGVDIDAQTAWALSTGAGTIIAVLDSGVDTEHPDLDVIAGWDYVDDDDDPNPDPSDDSAGHGTAAGGVAAATGNNSIGVAGVAYDAQVYGIRLLGDGTTTADISDAFIEAADAGAAVLTNSWGIYIDCTPYSLWTAMIDAFHHVEDNGRDGLGSVVVFSGGNGNCDNSADGLQSHEYSIAVAASSGHDVREWYSSYGDNVDIAGPSGGIVTTDISGDAGYGSYDGDRDYYGDFSGTSAAAPVVAGVAALMISANPRLTAADVREILCETAEPIDVDSADGGYDSDGWSPWYGCGRVNAGAAVAAVANTEPGTPEVIWPVETAQEDRVLLHWSGSDPDQDRLLYMVSWSVEGEDAVEVDTDEQTLDLTGEVAVGEVVTWTVAATDGWGSGPAVQASFEVVEVEAAPVTPEDPGGCSTAPGGVMAALMGLMGITRRRRER